MNLHRVQVANEKEEDFLNEVRLAGLEDAVDSSRNGDFWATVTFNDLTDKEVDIVESLANDFK